MSKKKVALVITGSQDAMRPFILDACSDEEKALLTLFPTDLPQIASCQYNPCNGDVLFNISGKKINGADICGVWWRRIVPPDLALLNSAMKEYCFKELVGFLEGLEYLLPNSFWISLPSAINKGKNKAFQLGLAESIGFRVPKTICIMPDTY